MAASTYTGTGATQSIVNSGNNAGAISFKPDFVWTKVRSAVENNRLYDSIRAVQNVLYSNLTNAETFEPGSLTAFNSNGFTVGAAGSSNTNAATYVAWQWQAGQGSTSSNTSGSITSTVSVNATAGFSVVTFNSNATAGATVGHGLGVAPSMFIVKSRSIVGDWGVYHASVGNTGGLLLNSTAATNTTIQFWNNTSPTSSVFTLGNGSTVNPTSGTNMVAYCWAQVAGFSKFGSYTGNGSADGPFVYLGFRPRFVMIKTTSSVNNWIVIDSSRDPYNSPGNYLLPNTTGAEGSVSPAIDFLSNGFKLRLSNAGWNGSSENIIYAAFAENPFKYSLAR
jgi:hypothetical protein